jgi:Uma2 family endonuclease
MHMPKLDRHWTADDLRELPDDGNRYEVIDGELFVYVAPADVAFSPRRLVQPDVFVAPLVNGRRPREWVDVRALLLAVEVLSPSTARADRVAKRRLFRDEGVPEYWIVDLDARTIERSTPADARPEVFDGRLEWRPSGGREPLVIDVEAYFAGVLDE